jgi:hypothetical protein
MKAHHDILSDKSMTTLQKKKRKTFETTLKLYVLKNFRQKFLQCQQKQECGGKNHLEKIFLASADLRMAFVKGPICLIRLMQRKERLGDG